MDLGFLIDGSGSIENYGRGNFKRCLRFVQNVARAFTISRRQVRVGIVLFSSRPKKIFGFKRYGTKYSVLRAIKRIRYPRGGTRTGLALRYTGARLFTRNGRRKVLIVMTDGRSSDRVMSSASALRRKGLEIFAVGIGRRYSMTQLRQIASDRRHVFTADFRNLNSVIRAIKQRACKGPRRPGGPGGRPSTTRVVKALAVYPLSRNTKGRDVSLSGNPSGRLSGHVRPAPGPDGRPASSYQFLGRPNSYILFPNRGRLDAKRSITLLAWIYHQGRAGPIFNYNPSGWGVHLWMVGPRTLFVRFTKRGRRVRFTPALISRSVQPRRWQFVGATYDQASGVARLIVNHRVVARRRIGRIRLATNYPAVMGAKFDRRDRRYFRGRISCMQVYGSALTLSQILKRRTRCFKRRTPRPGGIAPRPRPGVRPRPRPFPGGRLPPGLIGRICAAKLDLGFLVDGSGSIEMYGRGNFRRVLYFIEHMARSFIISRRFTRVGVVLFSNRPKLIFPPERYSNARQTIAAIRRIRYPKGGTRTGRALRYVRRRLFRRSGKRKKVLIVLTDGRSQDRVLRPARKLRRNSVEVFAFGVGRRYSMKQLIQMASDRSHVYTAAFRNLDSVIRAIKNKACKGGIKPSGPHRPSGTLRAVGLYPLNALAKTRDISFSRNPAGIPRNVKTAPGPDGSRGTSYEFLGNANSYIEFPNTGKLDTRRSITILAWIYHQGRAGPIFNYHPRAWGVHFWMIAPRTLFVRFTRRRTRGFTAALLSRSVSPNKWQYVGATYDHASGIAKLLVNGVTVSRKPIGRIRLSTNYPARMGARIGDGRFFKGRISCLQVYSVALSANQISARRRRCFVPALPKPRPITPPRLPFRSAGCWRDKPRRAAGFRLANFRGRADAVRRCYALAASRGYFAFGVQYGGECWSGPQAHRTYRKYGPSRGCRNGKGGGWANDIYFIIRRGGTHVLRPHRPVRPKPALPVCRARVDLGFVLDGSGSVGRRNFARCIQFIRNLVSSFSIHRSFTRVGIVVYSNRPMPQFTFGRYNDVNSLVSAIGQIRYPRGGTKTGRALHYARGYLFARSNRRKVLVVITDGRSYDRVHVPAAALRRMGVEILAVGVGRRYNSRQLIEMARNRRHVFTASFRGLGALVRTIKQKACAGVPPKPLPPPKGLRPVAVFPLSLSYKGREIQRRTRPGRLVNVRPTPGPDHRPNGAYYFYGRANSYIEIPRSGQLDTRNSITILAWIYHQGNAGPIVHYNPRGWGVHLWMVNSRTLFVRFTKRRGLRFTSHLAYGGIKPGTWQFVGTTYNRKTGMAKLYLGSRVVAKRHIGRIKLATNYPVRLGARIGDGRYFRGRMSCVQIYRQALPARIIGSLSAFCLRGGASLALPQPRPGGRVCTTRLDLGFVIDGSRTYGRRNFQRCVQFVKNLVRVFTVSARFTRVGVVLYASRPYKLFGFGRYGNRHGVVRAIGRMRYLRGRARTGRALRYARRYLFGRSKRRKVLIVMTGRKSRDNVHGPARGLRRAGIDVISLGLGKRYNTGQLKVMASSRRNVFTAGFTNLVSVVRAIKKKACGTAGRPSSVHVTKGRPTYTTFTYHWLGCYTDKRRRAISRKIGHFRGKPNPVGRCAALAQRYRYKVFAVEHGGECWSGLLAHKTFNQYGPSNKCKKGRGGPWAMDVYKFGKAGYKPVKRPIGGNRVTWRIQGVGCFRDNRRSPAVGRLVVNLKGVKNAVMRCFRQARKLGFKLFAVQDGGKCFAGPRGHLTYSKYGRSRGCRKGLGGTSAINVYRFSKCAGGRCVRPKPPRPFPRPISVPRPAGRVCRAKMDLGFLIDGSGSIEYYGKGNFRRCLRFVQRIVSSFTINPSYTRVGVVVFSRSARLIFGFNRYRNKMRLVKAISRIRYPRGGTKTGRALRYAGKRLFPGSRGRKKVLVVMTDGRSSDRVVRPARALRRRGVKIFCLGIGRKFNRWQLLQMAANRNRVFTARFRSLDTVARVIKRRVCRGTGKGSGKRLRKVIRGRFGRRFGRRKQGRRFGRRKQGRRFGRRKQGRFGGRFGRRKLKKRLGKHRKFGRRFGRRRKGWSRKRRRKMKGLTLRRRKMKGVSRGRRIRWRRRGKMRGISRRKGRKMMKTFGRRRRKMVGKRLRQGKMRQAAGRWRKTGGRSWRRRWKMRRTGGRARGMSRTHGMRMKGRVIKGGWKARRVGGRVVKRIRKKKLVWKIRKVGGTWMKMKGNKAWKARRVGGRWVRIRGVRTTKMFRVNGKWMKMKGGRGARKLLVGGRWVQMRGKGSSRAVRIRGRWLTLKGGKFAKMLRWRKKKRVVRVVRKKGRGRKVFGRRPRRRRRRRRRRGRRITWRKRGRRRRRGKRSHIEHPVRSPIPPVDILWTFKLSQNATALDEVHSRLAHLEGGATVHEAPGIGPVADTHKSEHGWISLGDFKGQCFSDPDECKHKGMTFMSWMKLHKEPKVSSSYILSSGGQTTKARGLALLHMRDRYILLLSTKDRQWKLETASLPGDWFNLAFTWKSNGTLQLFVNGAPVASATPVVVSRPHDLHTSFVIGRPNNAVHPKYRMPLEMQSIALWERALTDNELKKILQQTRQKDRPSKSAP